MKKYLVAAVAAAAMIVPATAYAQPTVPFQGSVYVKYQEPTWVAVGWTCPTQFYCGIANIVGYGQAFWSFDATSVTPVSSDCAEYVGTSTVTLRSDGSVLVLNEDEIACSPGNSGNTFGGNHLVNGTQFGGHPLSSTGTWTVCGPSDPVYPDRRTGCGEPIPGSNQIRTSTGDFARMTGSGTDALRDDGSILKAAWTGTVTQQ
jgi:hypothetical protein